MRILVIEDEVKVAAFVRQALTEEGHAVDVAHDGEAGLELARAADYDLLVLDWLLPGRDGLAVCRALRDAGSRLPILMLTARDAVEDRIRGLDTGADDYLVKPFALGELLARARALLRRGPAGTLPVLRVGDLTLDPATRRVRRGGPGDHPFRQGVRPAGIPDAPRRADRRPDPDHGTRLGLRLRQRHQCH